MMNAGIAYCYTKLETWTDSWGTYKELEDDAAVWIDVLKGDGARLLEINSIHESGCALICVGSNEISHGNPL